MTTPTRAARARRPSPIRSRRRSPRRHDSPAGPPAANGRARALGHDPDGGAGDLHELLVAAVDEAARLLEADGAMVYLVDPATGHLRFAHDAGIKSKRSREWVRSIDLPVGTGMFGLAVERRSVVLTRDYLADESFDHADDPDRVVRDIGIRSMVVAPLVAGDEVFGALGTFSSRYDAFSESDIRLVRALSDHAAAAMANARLIEALDASRSEVAARADVERTLREIAARISAATDLLGRPPADRRGGGSADARRRLPDRPHRPGYRPAPGRVRRRLAELQGRLRPGDGESETLDQGVAGQAVVTGRPYWTGDYVADPRFPHLRDVDRYLEATASARSWPSRSSTRPGRSGRCSCRAGGLTPGPTTTRASSSHRRPGRDHDPDDPPHRRPRPVARGPRPDRRRRADPARDRGRVSATHDQEEILQAVIDASVRLLGATGAMIDLVGDLGDGRRLDEPRRRSNSPAAHLELLATVGLTPDAGVSGRSMQTRQVEWTGAYLEDDRFAHTEERDAFVRASGIESVIAAPLIHRDVVVGAITVYGDRPDAFDAGDAALLGALADQAAVAIANARLIEELEHSRAEIARRADSERTLREIAARVSAILEPDEVLQQIVDETTRLLESDGARIDLYDPDIDALRWSYAAGDAMAKIPDWAATGGLKPGQAVAGTAFAEQRPVRTDDYLDRRPVRPRRRGARVRDRRGHPLGDRRAARRRRPATGRSMPRRSARCRSCRARWPPTTRPTARS